MEPFSFAGGASFTELLATVAGLGYARYAYPQEGAGVGADGDVEFVEDGGSDADGEFVEDYSDGDSSSRSATGVATLTCSSGEEDDIHSLDADADELHEPDGAVDADEQSPTWDEQSPTPPTWDEQLDEQSPTPPCSQSTSLGQGAQSDLSLPLQV